MVEDFAAKSIGTFGITNIRRLIIGLIGDPFASVSRGRMDLITPLGYVSATGSLCLGMVVSGWDFLSIIPQFTVKYGPRPVQRMHILGLTITPLCPRIPESIQT